MKIRTKLLITFIVVTMLVLVLFGVVAYRIAVDAAEKKEISLLEDFVREEAGSLSVRIDKNDSLRKLKAIAVPYETKSWFISLSHKDGTILYNSPGLNALSADTPLLSLPNLLDNGKTGGIMSQDDRRFLWASASVSESPYLLTIIQQTSDETGFTFTSLGGRLIGAGVVIMWIAVWGALVLSGIISRRLEQQNAKLIHQAYHDSLTGLPNRSALYNRLQQAIQSAHRDKKSVGLFIMDIDRFKEVNDTLGHYCGDQLLQDVCPRLSAVVRTSDMVARFGGDEFAVLLPSVGITSAARCAEKILLALQEPFSINNMDIEMAASIGVAIYPEHGENADILIQRAEVAMYQAKHSNSGFACYTPAEDPHSLRRLALMGELRHAIENDELALFYQPKVDLNSHRMVSVEALLRWQHKEHGFIPPDEFIPMAEQSGLIKPLTQWVLDAILRQCHAWNKMGIEVTTAVNLSPRTLHDVHLPERVAQMLEAWDIVPIRLEMEITESAIMANPDRARDILWRLDALGVRLAIDDFGTGYSSLAYLKDLPVDELKIDKSFVMDMVRDKNDEVIVRSTIDLAHSLGCKVTAEGVENQQTLDLLIQYGCDTVQGYYLSRPLPAEQLVIWLKDSPWGLRQHRPNDALIFRGEK